LCPGNNVGKCSRIDPRRPKQISAKTKTKNKRLSRTCLADPQTDLKRTRRTDQLNTNPNSVSVLVQATHLSILKYASRLQDCRSRCWWCRQMYALCLCKSCRSAFFQHWNRHFLAFLVVFSLCISYHILSLDLNNNSDIFPLGFMQPA
jgi:hypothetical protein